MDDRSLYAFSSLCALDVYNYSEAEQERDTATGRQHGEARSHTLRNNIINISFIFFHWSALHLFNPTPAFPPLHRDPHIRVMLLLLAVEETEATSSSSSWEEKKRRLLASYAI